MQDKCKTCMNANPSVACVNCGTGFRNYVSTDQQEYVMCAEKDIQELRDQNASLLAELKEYNDLAAEYGIDGKTMLTLAKSQIATAKSNCELQDELERYREAEKEGRLIFSPCKIGDTIFIIYGGGIVIDKVWKIDCLILPDKVDFIITPANPYLRLTFGKTVFLDRASAEAARKEQEDG